MIISRIFDDGFREFIYFDCLDKGIYCIQIIFIDDILFFGYCKDVIGFVIK